MRSAIACPTRAVPMASKGFIAAISRNPAAARTWPRRGTALSPPASTALRPGRASPGCRAGPGDLALGEPGDWGVERLLGDPVELLEVEQAVPAHRRQQRPVGEAAGDVAVGEDGGAVALATQPGRRQLGVARDEDPLLADVGGDGTQQRGLARPRRALQDDVP